ncbi:MAG: DsbA family protein [bacterium]|nr:DsbA family protein [bacterium]
MTRKLESIANVCIVLILLFLLFNPSGMLGGWIGERLQERKERRAVARNWEHLIDSASTLSNTREGSDGKPIVVEFLDCQCPACRTVAASVSEAVREGTVIVVVRHLPLERIHPVARTGAKAAICGEAQGRFLETHEALLGNGGWLERGDWVELGRVVSVGDPLGFAKCLESVEAETRVDRDIELAARLGITATPSFVTLNGIYEGESGFRRALAEVE